MQAFARKIPAHKGNLTVDQTIDCNSRYILQIFYSSTLEAKFAVTWGIGIVGGKSYYAYQSRYHF